MADLTGDDDATCRLLEDARRIAVVGASPKPDRDSYRIFVYLRDHGYDVVPVNPVADEVAGVPCAPDLAEAKRRLGGIDIVDVFRQADHLPGIVDEAGAVGARAVWGQFTVTHPDAVAKAKRGGMDIIMDRCIKVEHARLCGLA